MTKKWLMLALLAGTATLLSNGCLNAFWQGLWKTGWPANNRWINVGLDVANEVIFG
jgi:hypothetical protein